MYSFCWHRFLWWRAAVFNPGVWVWREWSREHKWKGTLHTQEFCFFASLYKLHYSFLWWLNSTEHLWGEFRPHHPTSVSDLTDAFVIVWFKLLSSSYKTSVHILNANGLMKLERFKSSKSPLYQTFKKLIKRMYKKSI